MNVAQDQFSLTGVNLKKQLRIRSQPAILLGLIAVATSLLVQSGNLGSVDTRCRLQVAHSWWTGEPEVIAADLPGFGVRVPDGVRAPYSLGQALVMLPADVLATLLVRRLPADVETKEHARHLLVILLTFPAIAAGIVLLAYSLLRQLGYLVNEAVAGALGLQIATSLLHYTQVHQENSLSLLVFLAGSCAVVRWSASGEQRWLAIAALVLGFDLLVRVTTIFEVALVLAFGAFLAGARLRARGEPRPFWAAARAIAYIAGPLLLVFVLVDRLYQLHRFGSLATNYQQLMGQQMRLTDPSLPEAFPFGYPFWSGFLGPLLSGRKCIILFDPLLLVGALALARGHVTNRATRAWIALNAVVLACDLALYATYFSWEGGACWANRYTLLPVHGLLLLALPLAIRAWPRWSRSERTLAITALAASLLIQISSILLSYNVEIAQGARLVVPQRFVNVVALSTGHFDAWGLSKPGYLETPAARRITLFPFVFAQQHPGRAGQTVVAGWLMLLAGLVALLLWCLRLARTGLWNEPAGSDLGPL